MSNVDKLSAESLRHGAHALGELALGDVESAKIHAEAAKLFADGAQRAVEAARRLNGDGE